MKALLLAAGYGSRLKPLTDYIPKPLTLFMSRPILDIVHEQVRAAGIQDIAVNTHHLADAIAEHIQKNPNLRSSHISFEKEILGTGGSVNPLREWLGLEDLLIFNGDIVASIDLEKFIRMFKHSGAKAGMVLIPHKKGTTPLAFQSDRVVEIGGQAGNSEIAKTFAGVHIISKAFIEAMPKEGFFSVIDTYQELLKAGEPIFGFEHSGFWADLGIPNDYIEAHRELWNHPHKDKILKALHLNQLALDYDILQESLFINCKRRHGFKRCFIFGESQAVTHGESNLEDCIVYPGIDLNKHSHAKMQIISPCASLNVG